MDLALVPHHYCCCHHLSEHQQQQRLAIGSDFLLVQQHQYLKYSVLKGGVIYYSCVRNVSFNYLPDLVISYDRAFSRKTLVSLPMLPIHPRKF